MAPTWNGVKLERVNTVLRLRDVDLNLLVVFQLLYEHRNTSLVAQKLGISQPAVSNCLARLRKQLQDELFERSAHGLSPTPYADKISAAVTSGLATLDVGLGNMQNFDVANSDRTFRLAMSEILEAEVLPRLYQYLKTSAPNICIQSVGERDQSLKHELEAGDIDLAIGFYPQLQAGFYQRGLFEEPYVCLLRTGHPMLAGPLTADRLAEFDHLIVEAKHSGYNDVEAKLRLAGVSHTKELHIPNFLSAPYIVRDSDLIVTLPSRFAQSAASAFGLAVIDHPVCIEPSWVRLFWHKLYHKDQGLLWLRQTLVDLCEQRAMTIHTAYKEIRVSSGA